MHQLAIKGNTSKIWINITNKGNKKNLNKQNKSWKIDKCAYIYHRINNLNDKNENDNSNDHGQPSCFKET